MTTYGYDVDRFGHLRPLADVTGMRARVRCTCGGVYDLGTVEVTGRYTDCSVWNAPCCGRKADDRGETGRKSTHDYYRLDRNGREVRP